MKYADVEGLAETHLLPAVRGGLLSRLRRTDAASPASAPSRSARPPPSADQPSATGYSGAIPDVTTIAVAPTPIGGSSVIHVATVTVAQ